MSFSPPPPDVPPSVEPRRPVRFSVLRSIARSPAHYRHALTASYDSKALRRGRLVDLLTFGGDPCVYDGTRRGKAWEAFATEHEDEDIFTASELEEATPIADSLHRPEHTEALALLVSGKIKERFKWKWLGRECSGEPDVAPLETGAPLVDLKTCRSAAPERFTGDALRYAYHAQLAWYRNGLRCAGRPEPRECYIVACESTAPYPVTVFRLTPRALDMGERLCRLWMETLLSCEATNDWPGYVQSAVDLDVAEETELTYGDEPGDDDAAGGGA